MLCCVVLYDVLCHVVLISVDVVSSCGVLCCGCVRGVMRGVWFGCIAVCVVVLCLCCFFVVLMFVGVVLC